MGGKSGIEGGKACEGSRGGGALKRKRKRERRGFGVGEGGESEACERQQRWAVGLNGGLGRQGCFSAG